ncbi:stemmadenine O-acetyltransferase-like [Coffea arabica]|uniref:Stemmadenine O-acetyltransferase-like n=1 Tax=Coffea arabica TaxID=13443 RepID=A0ABM4U5H3_COFAR
MEVVSEELIKPSSPTPHACRDLKLSLLDQLMPSIYVPLIFFYQNRSSCPNNIDQAKRCQHLKQSLSEVLTKFYPLAGRTNQNLSVDCNDSGALFVESRVHAHLSQALIQSTTVEEPNQYLPFEPFYASSKNNLMLGIQISFFECGGMAVGVCISHKLADAMSFVTFMNAWAATCRSQADEVVQPDFELAGRLFPPANIPLTTHDFMSLEEKESLVTKRFVFDKEKLDALKQLASSSASGSSVKDPTRIEAVSAFMWKNLSSITQAKVDHKTNFLAYHGVNLRPKMSLPGDRLVFGNLAIATTALLTMSDQDDHDKKYCYDLVGLLRTAIRKINGEYIKHVQSGVPYLNTFENNIKERLAKQPMIICKFTSWCRFPVYEVDYGWGKPIWVGTKVPPMKNCVIFLDSSCGDGIEAWANVVEDEMAMIPDELLSLATADSTARVHNQ